VLGAIAVFVIERKLAKASVTALVGAALTFFGFMHGEAIGFGETPVVAAAYLGVALFFYGCAKFATVSEAAPEHEHGAVPEPAE
jgi:adenine/guanine/hypoxanthine permease